MEAALRRYAEGPLKVVVDVGTADGLMLEDLAKRIGPLKFVGMDLSFPLLSSHIAHAGDGISKVQGDALRLPIRSRTADAVIVTAVIEHVLDPVAMLHESGRILRSMGLLIMTTPDPLMEQVASTIGLLKETGHQHTFNLKQLRNLLEENDFQVLEARKFVFSPVGFPAEKTVERFLDSVGLSFLLANQLLIARRP